MIQVFIIGGDGTQKGAAVIYEVVMTKAQRSCISVFFFSFLTRVIVLLVVCFCIFVIIQVSLFNIAGS